MSKASERATELIEEIKKAAGIGDGLVEWWAEDADRVNKMAEKARKFAAKVTKASKEGRAYCPTGEGGGVDNSCGGNAKSAPDGGGGSGGGSDGPQTPSEKYGPPMTPRNVPHTEVSQTSDSKAFLDARNAGAKRPENFSDLDPERLENAAKFLSKDGKSGCLVDENGDLGNVFNNGKTSGAGMDAVLAAIEQGGAQTLDCYDDFLPWKYAQLGFVATAKVKWSDEYAPPNWNYAEKGRPDVVIMSYQGGDRSTIRSRVGSFKAYEALPDSRYTDDFDSAKATARLSSEPPRRTEGRLRQHDQGEGRGARSLDPRPSEGLAGRSCSFVEPRAYCATGEGGGQDNSCPPASAGVASAKPGELVNIKLGNVRRQDVMLRGGLSTAVIDEGARERAQQDRTDNPMPPDAPAGSTADLYDRDFVSREDPKRPSKITNHDPVFADHDLCQNDCFVSHDAVGRLLTSRHEDERRELGGEGPAAAFDTRRELTPDQFEYVVSALKRDVDRAYEDGRNPGFYSTDIADCMSVMSDFYPELGDPEEATRRGTTPEDANFVFTMITAITSNGTDPALNLESADAIYRLYREHGSIRTNDQLMGGERAKEIRESLERFQSMIDEFGEARVRRVMSGVTHASTIDETMKRLARQSKEIGGSWAPKKMLKGDELADEVVPVSAVFGPKIGAFFANLSGKHEFLTMDRWLMRSVGRTTGELLTRSTPTQANKQANAALKAIRDRSRKSDVLFGVDKPPLSLTRDAVVKSLELQARSGVIEESGAAYAWSQAAARAYSKTPKSVGEDGTPRGSFGEHPDPQIRAAHKAGNTLSKSLIHEQQDPRSPMARRVLREVFKEVAERVAKENPSTLGSVKVSEIQAVLWQYEQNLWKNLGAKTKIEGDSLYSAAAKSLKQRREGGEPLRTLRPSQPNRPKSVRSYDPSEYVDPTSDMNIDRPGQSGQDLWDSEIETAQVDFAELLRAIMESGDVEQEDRAFCPTGEGGGVKNDCSSKDSPEGEDDDDDGDVTANDPSPPTPPSGGSGPEINIGDKREEIVRRLDSMGVVEDDVVSMAGGASDGTYVFMRRDHDHEGGDGLHVETTRDVAGVKGGLFSQSVIYNAGPAEDPEIVVEHKLMDVLPAVDRDPLKRNAAAREFFRIMTGSVEAAIKQGASKVKLNAADGAPFKGYTIWPRMGFDAPIPFHVRNKLPETLSHCRSLLDLHATSEGTRWWRDNGTGLDVQLDLTRPDSPQMQVFGKFVRHFERSRRELAVGEGLDWLSPEDTAKLEELWEEIWDEGLLDDYEGESEDFSTLEKRAFCPTGEGGGVKNDCSASDGGGSSVKELDNSWEDSDEIVEVYEGKDLERRPPIEGAEKLRSLAIESPVDMKSALDEMGVSLSDAVTMCAAPSEGTTVIVSPEHPYDSMGLGTPGEESKAVAFVMTTKDVSGIKDALDSNSSLRKTSDGELVLEYHAFHASAEAQEKAAVACAKEVIGGVIKSVSLAEKSGVSEIRLDAAGSKDSEAFKGYRMWPKFGFDGVIPRKMLTRLREADLSPRAVAEKRAGKLTIQALYETKAGQKYWEDRGQEIPMWLRPGDQSTPGWERFKAYRQRLGKLAENRSFEAGDEIFSDEELKKLEELWDEFRSEAAESRGFCATGEGGGIDNSCGSDGKAAPPPVEAAGLDVAMPSKNGWKSQEAVVYWDKNSLSGSVSPSKLLKAANSFTVVDGAELSGVLKNTGISLDDAIRVMASSDDDVNIIATAGDTAYAMGRMSGEGGGVASDSEFTVVSRKDVDGVTNAITVTTSMKRHESGELELKYTLLDVSPEVKENSRISIARQMMTSVTASIAAAEEVGVDTITMRAAGDASDDRYKGYRIWPRLGFDGEIPRNLVTRTWSPMKGVFNSYGDKIPDSVLSPKARQEKAGGKLTIQSLYETKEGQRWWEKYGGTMSMSLSVSDKESQGWKVYSKVRERFGKSSRDLLSAIAEAWIEHRAFCPTGDGNGIDNSCSPKMAADKDSGGGGSATSSRWGGDEANWGTSSGTEIWTPGKPLFAGSESLAAIKIHKPDDIRQRIVDGLGMTVAEAVLASGPIKEAADRASITRPRLEIIPQQFGDGIAMHWSAMGVTTGEGFQDDEKQFAKSGTAVKAVEASRNISKGRDGNVLHMGGFFIHPDFQGKGLALESVSNSVSSGAVRLVMEAERYDAANPTIRMTGYHIWPKYGYDASIEAVRNSLRSGDIPEQFSKAKSLLDIYAMPGGHEWWRENGGPIKLTFDARPRSKSREALIKFQDRTKERRSMPAPDNSRRGIDCDNDPILDEVWDEIQENGLSGEAPSQEDWDRWDKEDQEAKDGKAREV